MLAETKTLHSKTPSPLKEKWTEDLVRYSSVWEDFRCLERSLAGLPPGARMLSIGSAGENALSLLKFRPDRLTILDLSNAQSALVELKLQALKLFSFEHFMELLGFYGTPESRREFFEVICAHLSERTQTYWLAHTQDIQNGLINYGRLDSYFKKFRDHALPHIWDAQTFATMTKTHDLSEQLTCWQAGDLSLLKKSVSEFFNKTALSLEGRHASQFEYVSEENIGPQFLQKFVRLIQTQLISENPYVYLFMTGKALQGANAIPLFNNDEFRLLKDQAAKIEIVTLDLESYLSDCAQNFDFMNLSDIFEYLSDDQAQALFERLAERLNPGGVIAYWTLLVNREPASPHLEVDREKSEELTAQDQTWFYSAFKLIRKL